MPDIKDTAHIIRTINHHLLSNEDLLDTEGIMRLSGVLAKRNDLLDQIQRHGSLDNVPVPLLADAYKHYLQINPEDIVALISRLPNYEDYQKNFGELPTNLKAGLIFQLVAKLSAADDMELNYLAEIIYNYLHLATKIVEHEKNNKMTSKNMGVIVGPFLNTLLGDQNVSLKEFQTKSLEAGETAEIIIESDEFKLPFAEKYPEKNIELRADQMQWLQGKLAQYHNPLQDLHAEHDRIMEMIREMQEQLDATKESLSHSDKTRKKGSKKVDGKEFKELITNLTTQTIDLQKYKQRIQDEVTAINAIQETLASLTVSCQQLASPKQDRHQRRKSITHLKREQSDIHSAEDEKTVIFRPEVNVNRAKRSKKKK